MNRSTSGSENMSEATEILSDRIERKLALLGQLRDLGRRQAELIEAGDLTQLLKLLSAKQRLLAALQSLERELDPFRDEDPDARVWISPAHRQQCAKNAAACEEMLQSIVEQERHSENQMRLRRDEAAARLDGAHSVTAAHRAYAAEEFQASRRLDLTQG
jgi:hypothetical protein